MNYILACLVVFLSGSLGIVYAKEYVKKYNFYKYMVEFCQNLKINIGYNLALLENIFTNFKSEKWFDDFLIKVLNEIKLGEVDFEKLKTLIPVKLKDNEIKDILLFFKGLGKNDADGQKEFLDGYLVLFNKELKKNEDFKNKNVGVCTKVGLGLGVIVAIIIV